MSQEQLQGVRQYVDFLANYYESLTEPEARRLDAERVLPCKELARLIRLAQRGEL